MTTAEGITLIKREEKSDNTRALRKINCSSQPDGGGRPVFFFSSFPESCSSYRLANKTLLSRARALLDLIKNSQRNTHWQVTQAKWAAGDTILEEQERISRTLEKRKSKEE